MIAMGARDLATLVFFGAGTVVIGTLGTLLALRLLRVRSLALQVAVAAVMPALTALLGAWLGARAMFFSDHDLSALGVLLTAAGIVGVLAGWLFGRRVAVAEDRLDEIHRERAVESSRRELMAWVSHDLRTPLAGIRAMSEALADGVVREPADVARYHGRLRVEAERLGALVDDLFELGRAEHRSVAASLQRIALDDLVSDVIAGLAPIAQARGVHLVGRRASTRVELDAAAPELLRALRNVLENAIRYTPSDGSVFVETECRVATAVVTVRDAGGGIAAEHIDRVFEPGFRGDPARTPGHAGGGLGLAIARDVIIAHRGIISIENVDEGACVTIELPIAAKG